jgi:hypothetical protein
MKKNALRLFLGLALLMVGCMKHKNLEPKQQNEVSLSSKTKNRFYNYKQEALNKATFSRNNIEQTVSRTIALKWDSLEVENLSFLGIEQEVIAIPMRYKNRDMTKNGYRKLIIYKDQAGNDQIKVLEVTAQKEYLQAHNNTISKQNLTGYVTIHDLYNGFEKGIVLENGTITNAITNYTLNNPTAQRNGDCGYWHYEETCYSGTSACEGTWTFITCSNDIDNYGSNNGSWTDWMQWLNNQYANQYGQDPNWGSTSGGSDSGSGSTNPNNNGYDVVNLDEPLEPSQIDDGAPKPNAFNIKGKLADIQTFITLLNKATGNTYAYDADTKTIKRTSTTLNDSTNSTKSAYLSKLIEDVITGEKKFFDCNIVNNDSDVLFDNFPDGRIDIADLQKSPDNAFLTGLLVHLIEERIAVPNGGYKEDSKKKDYAVYDAAHKIALQKEAQVVAEMLGLSGVTKREETLVREPSIGNPVKETITYIYGTTKYEFKSSYDVIVNMEATNPKDKIKYVNKGVIVGSIVKK